MEKPKSDNLARLETVEGDLLLLVERVRSIRQELAKAIETTPKLEPFLDAHEVAKILDVDPAHVYSLARTGKIPSFKLGKYRRFSPNRIKKWLDRKGQG